MRTRELFRFEVGHQRRQPSTWISAALLLAVPLLLVAGGADPVGTGRLFDAPAKVATFTLLVGLLGTLVTAGLFVEAGHRDPRWRMDPLFYTAPLRKREYLGGRFLGALLVNATLLLAVPAGLLLGARLPAAGPGGLGPFRAEAYLLPYLFFLLPNLLVNAAVLFGITVLSRRSLPGYLGALGLVAAYMMAANATVGLEGSRVAALLDPTGAVALAGLTEGWTRAELDTRLIEPGGLLLWNRLLWTALGAGVLAFTCRRFRLAHAEPAPRRRRARYPGAASVSSPETVGRATAVAVPRAPRSFGVRTRARQALAVAGLGFRQTVLGRDFLLVAAGLFLFVLFMGMESMNDPMFGMPLWPLTHTVAAGLAGRSVGTIVALLTVFYAGELVWRERDAGMEKIGDSAPVPDWVPLAGKFLALGLMLAVLQAVLVASGMVLQALKGYHAFQPGLYLQLLFGMRLPDYLLFAVLALLVHVLVNQKHLGHLLAALLYLAIPQARKLGIEHNLLLYGSDPGWVYSEMSGFGPFVAPFAWFKLYWAAWALLLLGVALLFWVRGTEGGLRGRLRLARQRFTPRAASGAAAAALLVLATGGFIFYNTNVLNQYRTAREADGVEAEYERRYKRFEHAPRPWLTGMRLHVELHPEQRRVAVRGSYRLVNRTGAPIDSVHLSSFPDPELTVGRVRFDRPARPVLEDPVHGYRIYALAQSLQPGDSLRMHFEVGLEPRGFRNRELTKVATAVMENGTYLEMRRLLPAVGYQRELLELSGGAARREHGLGPRGAFRPIDDPRALRLPRSSPEADWIDFEATVGTAGDQVAVLPGTLRRTWTKGGRRYFHYRTEAPFMNSVALTSARYAVREARWKGVEIRVLHHPGHAFNLDRVVRGVRASLEYYTEQFGPYPHRRFTVVEIPRYDGNFARAYPGGLVYTEVNPLAVARIEDGEEDGVDTPLLFIAHETAHQWWGHQVMGADVQGSQVLSETLAQYSAVMVLERTHGAGAARRYLRSMHLSYLEGRGGHATPEVPLLLSGDHNYIHYRKGAVAMYALRDYVGEEQVSLALRRLVGRHGMRGPPYPTSLDLYRELRAVTPDSLQYLLEDLFATITLWDLRAAGARAEPAGAGEYRVTLEVEAAKLRSDSVGNDREAPMDDLVEIGVFGDDAGEPLYLRKHRVHSGRQTVTVTVRGRPARAGIDPHRRLIARHVDALIGTGANMAEVEIGKSPGPMRGAAGRSAGGG